MTDPNHIPGYDAWKTSGPDEDSPNMRTYIEASLIIDFTRINPDALCEITLEVKEALTHACTKVLGLDTDDFEVGIETASQEWDD